MTDQITVDFNSRDAQGFVPASRRRLATLPEVGSIISAVDLEENHCLARVIAIGPASITLEPLWQTFATPEQSRVVTNPAGESAPRTASDGSDVPDSTVGSKMRPRR